MSEQAAISPAPTAPPKKPAEAGKYASIAQTGSGANIRYEPSLSSEVLRSVPAGFPLAVLDGTWVTDMRTGASAGVATKYLARPDSSTLGIIGAGRQACTQLMAMNEVMEIEKAKVYCRTCSTRSNFAKNAAETYGFDVEAVDSPQKAVDGVDVVVTTTPSRKPLIKADWISPGTHINAMGADAPSKQELETSDVEPVLAEVIKQTDNFLWAMWIRLSPDERDVITLISQD